MAGKLRIEVKSYENENIRVAGSDRRRGCEFVGYIGDGIIDPSVLMHPSPE